MCVWGKEGKGNREIYFDTIFQILVPISFHLNIVSFFFTAENLHNRIISQTSVPMKI